MGIRDESSYHCCISYQPAVLIHKYHVIVTSGIRVFIRILFTYLKVDKVIPEEPCVQYSDLRQCLFEEIEFKNPLVFWMSEGNMLS